MEPTSQYQNGYVRVYVYVDSDGTQSRLDPEEEGVLLAPILRLRRVHVKSGLAFKNGRLRMVFEDNSQIEVPPSREFEAWNINGGDGLLIVSIPGGDLAIWKSLGLRHRQLVCRDRTFLFIIAGEHLPEVPLDDSNLSKDLIRGCHPLKRLSVLVPCADVVFDDLREM